MQKWAPIFLSFPVLHLSKFPCTFNYDFMSLNLWSMNPGRTTVVEECLQRQWTRPPDHKVITEIWHWPQGFCCHHCFVCRCRLSRLHSNLYMAKNQKIVRLHQEETLHRCCQLHYKIISFFCIYHWERAVVFMLQWRWTQWDKNRWVKTTLGVSSTWDGGV